MLKKLFDYFKHHYESFLIFLGLLLIISPVILSKPLNDLDEIWNYNFARNIADGLIPYKDFNMVPTPLLPFIASLFLKIFGNQLFTMRILAILLNTFIFFMIYKILKKLNVNIFLNLLSLFLIFFILKDYICIDYNFANLLFILIIIYLELDINLKINNYLNKKLIYYFLIGLLCGCCILFKQSTGLLVTIISILYPILFIKKKIDFKKYLKLTFIKILGIIIPIILLLIYLLLNNALNSFIDYTILGIKTFNNSISYFNLFNSKNIIIKLLSIFIPIFIIFSGIYLLIKKEKYLYSFYCYSISALIVSYPIADNIHFLIGITPFLVLIFYYIFILLKFIFNNIKNKNLKFKKYNKFLFELFKAIVILSLCIYLIFSIYLIINYLNDNRKNHNLTHYKDIPISNELINKINIIDNYISNENNLVYILDSTAAIYMIPLNKYNKDFDMFNKGNFGDQGEQGQIEKIKQLKKGTKILIKNRKYSLNWQTPIEVINYIKNNLNKINEINIFDIYEI